MNFFQKIGNSLARFMYGRNGVDQLGFVTLWAAIILDVVNLFVRNQVAYSILSAVAMVLTIWMVFRMFSKNLSKRRAENAAYMNKVVYPLRQALSRSRDKEHKYFTCPNCRTVKPLLQKAGVPYEEKDAAQYAEEAKALGLRQAPTLVVWGEEPTLYVGAAQIKAFLREYAQ
mgnify:CR=1 FL=1